MAGTTHASPLLARHAFPAIIPEFPDDLQFSSVNRGVVQDHDPSGETIVAR